MQVTEFNELIKELGSLIDVELESDQNDACKIVYPEEVAVQIELSNDQTMINIVSYIGEVPAGRFREDLFQAALQFDGKADKQPGVLCYIEDGDLLALYDRFEADQINANKLKDIVSNFHSTAIVWKEGLEQGRIPDTGVVTRSTTSFGSSGGMFGLRP